ncbi:PREDICTED: phosphatidylethanolamine-binding protein 4 [Haliaeetus leucocephalus]|uniref:phosphatidylethanolamine-binding protein 4 n=1 Tax=Haliaeetus leucocephalus TaxID=52644 RepID=UPI00053CBA9E|nr:PREDICTED: phosphatidylethanolamine-binding protein 4 [Haliaeetus leucocephalus]
MKLLGAVLLAASLLGTAAREEQSPWPDDPLRTCFFQMLSGVDGEFCRGDLEIIYPELGDVGCTYIPKCHQYRRRISREWGSPRVRYPQAEKSKKYVLVLVDPDAPSRANPRNRFWRHWLVTDIPARGKVESPRNAGSPAAVGASALPRLPGPGTSPWGTCFPDEVCVEQVSRLNPLCVPANPSSPRLMLCLVAFCSPRVQKGLFWLFSAAGLCPSGLAMAVADPVARRVSLWFGSPLV